MNDPIYSIVQLLSGILSLLTYGIIARAVLSWIRPNPGNPLVRLLHRVTDPIMRPIEQIVPNFGGLDVSPIIAIVLIQVVRRFLESMAGTVM